MDDDDTRVDEQLAAIGLRGATRSASPPSRGASPPSRYRLPSRGAYTPEPQGSTAPPGAGRASLHNMMLLSSCSAAGNTNNTNSVSRRIDGRRLPEWKPVTSDTARKVRAAQLANPNGWTKSISSYLPVATVPKDLLDAPVEGLRGGGGGGGGKVPRRRTLSPL